jgi:hypothetical protein
MFQFSEGSGNFKHSIGKRRFSMVNMSDNAKVANGLKHQEKTKKT